MIADIVLGFLILFILLIIVFVPAKTLFGINTEKENLDSENKENENY